MATGINLTDLTGNPAIILTPGNEEGAPGSGNFDNWTWTIDVDALGVMDPDDLITLHGDWDLVEGGDLGGYGYGFSNDPGSKPFPMFANLAVDGVTGEMTMQFTYAQLMENADKEFDFVVFGDIGGGSSDADKVRFVITCFLPGTLIATPSGDAVIESLAIGDSILTSDGREVAVKWVGRKTMKTSVFLDDAMLPVCVSAGAFGNGLPRQDLYLSANHGIIMGDALVNAGALVNDETIRFVALADMPATFTYYHIETEAHDEILANGAPVETFVDYVGRKGFDNYDEYVALYGCDRIIPEMKRLRISSRRQLPRELREKMGIGEFTETVSAEVAQFLARKAA